MAVTKRGNLYLVQNKVKGAKSFVDKTEATKKKENFNFEENDKIGRTSTREQRESSKVRRWLEQGG